MQFNDQDNPKEANAEILVEEEWHEKADGFHPFENT